ncbi:response regulator [Mucilaginibacter pocheonensis]|uniref:CheY-like chemotaxis protein n=1 Tax=Mucilaginibacter pocheonensis TaxID=398050 RepID=A0ABU1TCW5_9SPHI|nr:response regulator [Mucilaginibacter pocheonensis]MDR6943178.1 CheY-like chemotaxis protein [Mucilaginibacter pocheonensis]
MKKRILLIDDDDALLEVLNEALSYEGYAVKCVQNTNGVFTEIQEFKPDIIVTDYLLNGINGGELCHQIKQNLLTNHLPVLILSAYPKMNNTLEYYGCDAFIPKPFDLFDFMTKLSAFTAPVRN